MKFNISLVSLMHAVNNQCQNKITFQPVFFHWLLETKSHCYLFALFTTAAIFRFVSSQKSYKKKVMKIYNISKIKPQCPVHICSPPSCLHSSPSPVTLATWWMESSFFRVLPQPLEKFPRPCRKEKACNYNREKTTRFEPDFGGRREQHRENERHLHRHRAGDEHWARLVWANPTPSLGTCMNNTRGVQKGQIPLINIVCFIFSENRKILKKLRALALSLCYVWFSLFTAAWNSYVNLFRIVSAF